MTLKQIAPTIWELPKGFKPGMKVAGRIVATPQLLEAIESEVFNQLANAASLPGVVEPVWIMPDTHVGYGVPIGAVFATDPDKGGVISPGGIGFDINCLPGETKIHHPQGYTFPIRKIGAHQQVLTYSPNPGKHPEKAKTANIFVSPPKNLIKIKTKLGWQITLSEDHPLLTQHGLLPAKEILKGEKVAIYPFSGPKWQKPKKFTILTENQVRQLIPQFLNPEAIIKELKKRNLLPLESTSPLLPIITKLMGVITGDGNITLTPKTQALAIWGKKEDLKTIAEDIQALGFSAKIYSRLRHHRFKTNYQTVDFDYQEDVVRVNARSICVFFAALGVPVGNKTKVKFLVPSWLFKLPNWAKAFYLAGFFGAEMTKPQTHNGFNFYEPTVSINKRVEMIKNGYQFLRGIKRLLKALKIKTRKIKPVDEYQGVEGKTLRLRLQIASNTDNLLRLYQKVGFSYCQEKQKLALATIVFLRLKRKVIQERHFAEKQVQSLYQKVGAKALSDPKLQELVNRRFLERSVWEGRKGLPRPPKNFPGFNQFIKVYSQSLNSGIWWDEVAIKKELVQKEPLFDITVNHPNHTFIAENFIVSNCGVRLLTTNLTVKEIQPKLTTLVDQIFRVAGAGVGARSDLKLSQKEIELVCLKGAKWALDQGFGWPEDLDHCEERGCLAGADPKAVSSRAFQRGLPQLGTLGSGNHYLEIQKVAQIFDPQKAKQLGIFQKDQITIMIHCGSRGFGHQIASDYLYQFGSVMKKYQINLPDRQLACAPINSPEGKAYFAAMACAVNFAFCNRQLLTHKVRQVFGQVFGQKPEKLGLNLVYDVAHNVAKWEKGLLIHRKGATRAFGPNNPALPQEYQSLGQPVIIGGSMETASYLLLGTKRAEELTFASTCHGAGRVMSRTQAKRQVQGKKLQQQLRERGIYIKTASYAGLAEEAGLAYKNIDLVIEAVTKTGLSQPIAQFQPLGNIKG